MAHRYKPLKPLGKSKKSMKSESGASHKQLPTVAESAGIFDFLYVDRARVSALYAQLFPQGGVLTSVKTKKEETFSDENNLGSDIKVIKAEAKTSESGLEGIEHLFDPTWSIPVEVLERLKALSLVRDSIKGAGLGSIILTDCYLRVIDFSSMENVWGPSMKAAVAMNSANAITLEAVPSIIEALKAMPSAIHARYLSSDAMLWSSLQPANLTIPITDLTLKYGGTVSGSWNVVYILDTWADAGEPPDVSNIWSAGPLIDTVLLGVHGLRSIMGRPSTWIGITPLMIFRDIAGWTPASPKS